MGLDSVELVIGFEDAFGIAIPDEAAACMRTPRDVIEYVMERVEKSAEPACVSQRGFHLIRREFTRTLAIARNQIRPKAQLSELIPRAHRKHLWPRIGIAVGAGEWPSLVRPQWLFNLLALLSVVAAVAVSVQLYRQSPELGAWVTLVGIGSLILVSIALAQITRPLRTEFATDLERVEDLVRWVVAKSPGLVMDEPGRWTRERVALTVRQIVIEELGVAEVHEDSRFVEDLGMN